MTGSTSEKTSSESYNYQILSQNTVDNLDELLAHEKLAGYLLTMRK